MRFVVLCLAGVEVIVAHPPAVDVKIIYSACGYVKPRACYFLAARLKHCAEHWCGVSARVGYVNRAALIRVVVLGRIYCGEYVFGAAYVAYFNGCVGILPVTLPAKAHIGQYGEGDIVTAAAYGVHVYLSHHVCHAVEEECGYPHVGSKRQGMLSVKVRFSEHGQRHFKRCQRRSRLVVRAVTHTVHLYFRLLAALQCRSVQFYFNV